MTGLNQTESIETADVAAHAQAYIPDRLIASDIQAYLSRNAQKPMVRFITCGSVDDGKSTLIGRLLYDSKMIFDDQLSSLATDSKRIGTQGQEIDFALLVDGLAAEREQGITIDVAYRFFTTEKRKYIVADCPGHEQYTRNMVTGASTADVAIILIDARKGILPQTRRHSYLVHLLGVKHIVLAVNKMDLIEYDQTIYAEICAAYQGIAREIGIASELCTIPISGFRGDNIIQVSPNMPWYHGKSLIGHLDDINLDADDVGKTPFRMPVQWVNRPNLDFRGFAGTIASGQVQTGDAVRVLPSGKSSHIARIISMDGDLQTARAGQAITLTLSDEIDCSRGDVLVALDDGLSPSGQLHADIVWVGDKDFAPQRSYWLKLGTQRISVAISRPEWRLNIATLAQEDAANLALNDIGHIIITAETPIMATPYAETQALGSFILIDKMDNSTVAAGMVRDTRTAARNIFWQTQDVSRTARARIKGQDARILWFTGLSGSGKSTIANLVEKKLHALGKHSFLLDGDNVRHGLNADLGFGDEDRVENVRRVAEVARLMSDAGLIVISAFISPFAKDRAIARAVAAEGEFLEIYINTPLDVAEARDPKGLYKKARAGNLPNFTGIDSAYEPPISPEILIDTTRMSAEDAAEHIVMRIMGDWAYQI